MNFENAFLDPRSIQVCHLRSKMPLTGVDWLREQPRLIQRGCWPPRVLCWHSSSPPWPCAQQVAAAARRNATAAHEGDGKGGGSCRPTSTPCRPSIESRPPPGVRAVPPELWELLGSAPSRALPMSGLGLAHRPDDASSRGSRGWWRGPAARLVGGGRAGEGRRTEAGAARGRRCGA